MKNFLWVLYKPMNDAEVRLRDKTTARFMMTYFAGAIVAILIFFDVMSSWNSLIIYPLIAITIVGMLAYAVGWFTVRNTELLAAQKTVSRLKRTLQVVALIILYYITSAVIGLLLGVFMVIVGLMFYK